MKKQLKKSFLSWPSPIVSRSEIKNFTGGLLSPGTLANLDCRGLGPRNKIRMNRRVAYEKDSLIEWLLARLDV